MIDEIVDTESTNLVLEFADDARDALEDIDAILLRLEKYGFQAPIIEQLTQRLRTLESIFRVCGHPSFVTLSALTVDILSDLLSERLPDTQITEDVVFFAVEQLQVAMLGVINEQPMNMDKCLLQTDALAKLHQQGGDIEALSKSALTVLSTALEEQQQSLQVSTTPVASVIDDYIRDTVQNNSKLSSQRLFFLELANKVEACNPEWQGRSARILKIANAMNAFSDEKVAPIQLEAAVYLHDFGMHFLPGDPLKQGRALSAAELKIVQQHPLLGAETLFHIGGWDEAVTMILQHHERIDGTGYPKKLKGNEICEGAKILAVADTVYAMTNVQVYRDFGRPLFRAVTELNRCAGTQFCEYWVDIFTKIAQSARRR